MNMSASDQQLWVTRALASLAAAEWHDYPPDRLMSVWREVVRLIWSQCDPTERKFLERYGAVLQSGAIPCYPLMAESFTVQERAWLRKIYELEPCVGNALYYAQRLAPSDSIVRYDLWEES